MSEKTLPERVAMLEQAFISMSEKMTSACGSIDKIENKLMGRPSWSVSLLITSLSTILSGLVIFIFSNLNKF